VKAEENPASARRVRAERKEKSVRKARSVCRARKEKPEYREILANAARRVQEEKLAHKVPLALREPQLLSTFMMGMCSRGNKEMLVSPDRRVLSVHVDPAVNKDHKVPMGNKVQEVNQASKVKPAYKALPVSFYVVQGAQQAYKEKRAFKAPQA
jgi:hypothetical protein